MFPFSSLFNIILLCYFGKQTNRIAFVDLVVRQFYKSFNLCVANIPVFQIATISQSH